ncbi:MAG: cell division protein FtsZ [Candidatus Aenigmarchaeota archaeon]|nr:cell division protein FtsZ [Candidatus Aenigmarchaeota archaeon]
MTIQDLFESAFAVDNKAQKKSEERAGAITSDEKKIYNKESVNIKDLAAEMKSEFGIESYTPKIYVVGCGGMGSNVISSLTELGILGAQTVALNTDAAHLVMTKAHKKILIGKDLTKGLGAGGEPNVGAKAAEESKNEVRELLKGANLVFIVTGLGGGTGSGSAPVVAKIAKEQGAVVIATATLPFQIEGARMGKAEDALYNLRQASDTVIVIENQRLLEFAGNRPLRESFKLCDQVISQMVKGVTETISQPSLVNLDYADVRTIMRSGGVSTIGIGLANSSDKAKEAVKQALSHPLLNVDYAGATGALIQIIGGPDLKLEEVNEVGQTVTKHMSQEAQTIWGARILDEMEGKIQVITIVTGVKSPYILGPMEQRKPGEVQTESSASLGIEVFR